MKNYLLSLSLLISLSLFGQKEYYELRTYSIPFNGSEKSLHYYLEESLLPALNRYGVENIGVFETIGNPIPKKIILLIPYKNISTYGDIINSLRTEKNL
jgi:hypothetical protein